MDMRQRTNFEICNSKDKLHKANISVLLLKWRRRVVEVVAAAVLMTIVVHAKTERSPNTRDLVRAPDQEHIS
jgi:hypothetical protein